MPRSAPVITFQCPADLLAGVDRMAEERVTSRSEAIRAAITRGLDIAPTPMTFAESLSLLAAAARRGDMRAILASVGRLNTRARGPAD